MTTKVSRHYYPTITVAVFALAIAGILAVLLFQYLTADKPAGRLIATNDASSDQQETPVTESEIVEPVQAATETPQQTVTNPVSQPKPKATTTVPTSTPAAQPEKYLSTTTGTPEANVTVSNGGCTITAVGTPGMILRVATHNTSKGGETSYTIPASGTITVHPGGKLYGMDIDIWLITPVAIPGTQYSAGSILVYAGDTITNLQGC